MNKITASPTGSRITAVYNQKGGVGKTSTILNMAGALARGIPHPDTGVPRIAPQRTLLIDLERLTTVTTILQCTASSAAESSAALFQEPLEREDDRRARFLGIIQRPNNEEFDFLPSEKEAITAANNSRDSDFHFLDNIAALREDYDHILIDLPGNTSDRVLRSVLAAVDGVIIPVKPDTTVLASMRDTISSIGDARRGANQNLQVDGWLLTISGPKGDKDAMRTHRDLERDKRFPLFRSRIRSLKGHVSCQEHGASVYGMQKDRETIGAFEDLDVFLREWCERIGRPIPRTPTRSAPAARVAASAS